jgi:hypothetical protein
LSDPTDPETSLLAEQLDPDLIVKR